MLKKSTSTLTPHPPTLTSRPSTSTRRLNSLTKCFAKRTAAAAAASPEFELTDAGVFDGNRYWDITAEYAKASPDDILIRLTVANRCSESARLHLLPTLWFRNTWSWGAAYDEGRWPTPSITRADERPNR